MRVCEDAQTQSARVEVLANILWGVYVWLSCGVDGMGFWHGRAAQAQPAGVLLSPNKSPSL
jgi:hypothetical protein